MAISITTPSRAAQIFVPSGMGISTAYLLWGAVWLNFPLNACEIVNIPDSKGSLYGFRGLWDAFGSPSA
ncbi:hypothetical protein [Desulfonema limicola]|uniref:hypothetical protein n=1 Tax=Desulfonema limicola TaxID=45656 RepID=UPI001A9B3812|nr:hypothetical protein [Desulfonema limicola]